jgi:diguanylate cyclase (GGDEF)-like protein/PAS domain S-box-containing protein
MTDILLPRATAPDAPPSRRRFRITALGIGYTIAYLLWARFGGASAPVRETVSESMLLPLTTTLAVLFHAAAWSPGVGVATRRALILLAAYATALVLGNLIVVLYLVRDGAIPSGSLADAFYLGGYVLMFAGLLSIPGGRRSSDRWKLLCDAGMVLAGAGVALWFFVLRPSAVQSVDPRAIFMALVYPLCDLLLLVGVVSLIFRRAADGSRKAITWLAIGSALSVVADLAFNLLIARTGQRMSLAIDALYLANYVALIVSAELFLRGPIPEVPGPMSRLAGRLRAYLPFMAAGATYVLLLVTALREWVAPLSGVAIGGIAVSICLGARQLFAFRRNAEILAEAAVRASEARFRSLVQHSSDLIFLLDAQGLVQFASSSAARVIGYEAEALVGVELAALAHADDVSLVAGFVELATRRPGVSPAAEWRLRRPDGEAVQVEAIATNMLGDPTVRGVVLNARDVGERKALLDQLAHQAFHDPLTGLANRALFYDRVSHALALAGRQGRAVLMLFLDLDDFKQVNDTLGHVEGDRLLTMVAARLRACARTTDTVARLGGDEFALLVEDYEGPEAADRLVTRIHEQMAFPFTLAGTDVRISASIGSALAHGGAVDDILRHADLAMYTAKRSEKGTHREFETSMLGDGSRTS